jgi:hypothetical protein
VFPWLMGWPEKMWSKRFNFFYHSLNHLTTCQKKEYTSHQLDIILSDVLQWLCKENVDFWAGWFFGDHGLVRPLVCWQDRILHACALPSGFFSPEGGKDPYRGTVCPIGISL